MDSYSLFRSVQKKIDRVNQVLREKLMGVRVIRAFVKDDYEARRFDQANKDLMQTTLKVNRLMAFGIPSLMAIMNLAMVAKSGSVAYALTAELCPLAT